MINAEVIKEFLRDAYNEGAFDLGVDRKFLEGFLRIFAGEQEAIRIARSIPSGWRATGFLSLQSAKVPPKPRELANSTRD